MIEEGDDLQIMETFARFGRAIYMANVVELGLAHTLLQIEFLTPAREKFIQSQGKNFDRKKFDAEFEAFMEKRRNGSALTLIWYHPVRSPLWAILGAVLCQALSIALTVIFLGRWQAKLAQDPRGSQSPYLTHILRTHWMRTLLINAYALMLLVAAIGSFG
jgi:hypothetical protein